MNVGWLSRQRMLDAEWASGCDHGAMMGFRMRFVLILVVLWSGCSTTGTTITTVMLQRIAVANIAFMVYK